MSSLNDTSEPTLSFDIGTEKIQYLGYILISPSRDVVVSLFRNSYYKSVRLGGFKSVEMEMSHHGFFKIFRINLNRGIKHVQDIKVYQSQLPCVWQYSYHYLFSRFRSVATEIRTLKLPLVFSNILSDWPSPRLV